jgi:hypothetical protein
MHARTQGKAGQGRAGQGKARPGIAPHRCARHARTYVNTHTYVHTMHTMHTVCRPTGPTMCMHTSRYEYTDVHPHPLHTTYPGRATTTHARHFSRRSVSLPPEFVALCAMFQACLCTRPRALPPCAWGTCRYVVPRTRTGMTGMTGMTTLPGHPGYVCTYTVLVVMYVQVRSSDCMLVLVLVLDARGEGGKGSAPLPVPRPRSE